MYRVFDWVSMLFLLSKQETNGYCVCVRERACVCVRPCMFMWFMRTQIGIMTQVLQVLQGEGDFSGHFPKSPCFKPRVNLTE